MELFWCAYFFLANLIGSPAGAGRPNLGRVESLPCLFVGIPIVHHTWDTGGGGFTQIPTFRHNNALAPALGTMFTVVACTLLK